MYKWEYKTPEGYDNLIMNSDGTYLTCLCFKNSSDIKKLKENSKTKDLPIFKETAKWLDIYFSGQVPDFTPKYKIENLTDFRKEVIDIMNKIPYGKTTTYSAIAQEIATSRHISKMSSQAVGGAVGWNKICLIIPCHRVIGKNNELVGYGGGLKNKLLVLELEKESVNK